MRIEHVAMWVEDLEAQRAFYERHFGARAGAQYARPGFASYFLRFDSGARLELMKGGHDSAAPGTPAIGLAHLAIQVDGRQAVDALTERLAQAGVRVVSPPRVTGDGYYESVVLDPEGNRLELVA